MISPIEKAEQSVTTFTNPHQSAMDLNSALALEIVRKREGPGVVKKLKKSLGQIRRKNTALSKICRKDKQNFDFVAVRVCALLDQNKALQRLVTDAEDEAEYLREQLHEAQKKVGELQEQLRRS